MELNCCLAGKWYYFDAFHIASLTTLPDMEAITVDINKVSDTDRAIRVSKDRVIFVNIIAKGPTRIMRVYEQAQTIVRNT